MYVGIILLACGAAVWLILAKKQRFCHFVWRLRNKSLSFQQEVCPETE